MSQGALDRTTFEAIEAYVLDRMPSEERVRFEQRMANDATLREEVRLGMENIRAVELGGVTRLLREIGAEERSHERASGGSRAYLKYAAAIAVLAIGAIWWVSRSPANEKLFAEHFVADPGLPVAMGASDDHAFHDAMVAYKLGEYKEAHDKWVPLLQAEPMNDTLRFYIASASLAMGNAQAAAPLFEGLANDGASVFRARSQWYLFLAYVRMNDRPKAQAMPLESDATYGERARSIKAELR